jgi:dTDP-4-dehydrorhamnose reductase
MIKSYSQDQAYIHPVLDKPGWWRRTTRLSYPPVRSVQDAVIGMVAKSEEETGSTDFSAERNLAFGTGLTNTHMSSRKSNSGRGKTAPLLIITSTTAPGLGQAFGRLCEVRDISCHIITDNQLDITHAEEVLGFLKELRPWAVINAADYNQVDNAEQQQATCLKINTYGAKAIATACNLQHIPLVTFSTDQVFNGNSHAPYLESSHVNPLNLYGRSKAEAEKLVRQAHKGALIIRTGPHLCPWDEDNFLTVALRNLEEGLPIVTTADRVFSPTYVPDLVNTSLDLLLDGEAGIWHLSATGATTFADLIRDAAQMARLNTSLIEVKPANRLSGLSAAQPRYSVLSSERGILLPSLENVLEDYYERMSILY